MPDDTNTSNATAHRELLRARLPQSVRESLTEIQLEALVDALQPTTEHIVDRRISVRWLRRRYYVRLFIGHEKRSPSRLRQEKQLDLGPTIVFLAVSVWMIVSLVMMAAVSMLYLVKVAYGFDFFDSPSFLHACFFN